MMRHLVGPREIPFCLMVRMFDFRTKFVTCFVWLLAAIQLLLQPSVGLLHSGCEGHSHRVAHVHDVDTTTQSAPPSFWQSIEDAWRWVTHSGCCQHSHADRSAVDAKAGPTTDQLRQCSSSCVFCSRKRGQDPHQSAENRDHPSEDSSAPSHDFHQCVICQVVFAARLNIVTVQVPTWTDRASLSVPAAVPAVEIAPRFQLPTRGPPVA